jgi:hypothetical protein
MFQLLKECQIDEIRILGVDPDIVDLAPRAHSSGDMWDGHVDITVEDGSIECVITHLPGKTGDCSNPLVRTWRNPLSFKDDYVKAARKNGYCLVTQSPVRDLMGKFLPIHHPVMRPHSVDTIYVFQLVI